MSNCSEQEETTPERVELILTEPSNGSEVSHCCLVFDWEPIPSEQEYKFQLSTEATFDSILIDKLVNGNSLLVDYLDPSLIYYWKVTSSFNNFTSDIFSFSGINYAELYSGEYNATETVYSYYFAETLVVHIDSTYDTTINIQSTLDGNFMINDQVLNYEPSFEENIIKLGLSSNWDDNGKTVTINLDSGSFIYIHGIYGGGGGYTSTTTAQLK